LNGVKFAKEVTDVLELKNKLKKREERENVYRTQLSEEIGERRFTGKSSRG
jgi:hypothetical protein